MKVVFRALLRQNIKIGLIFLNSLDYKNIFLYLFSEKKTSRQIKRGVFLRPDRDLISTEHIADFNSCEAFNGASKQLSFLWSPRTRVWISFQDAPQTLTPFVDRSIWRVPSLNSLVERRRSSVSVVSGPVSRQMPSLWIRVCRRPPWEAQPTP